jgi:hemerythrin
MENKKLKIIEWRQSLSMGIPILDRQHRGLLQMTNDLFTGCLYGRKISEAYFRTVSHKMMDHIKTHFLTEELMMEKSKYPYIADHQKQHREFIDDMNGHMGKFENGEKLAPQNFVRQLREWFMTHIAIVDKKFGIYYVQKLKEGAISLPASGAE